jgi:3-hydroxyisobutyrate dehydrogenase-like beta-hydroxyacid dehydrogenase
VILSLATDAAFGDVVDELAVASGQHSPPIVVDTSTLALTTKETARSWLADVGITLFDCPVSGTSAQPGFRSARRPR